MTIYEKDVLVRNPGNTWGNTIIWRLAVALGYAKVGDGNIDIDPDLLLRQTEEMIRVRICGYDVGDLPDSCRCLLPIGHSGLHHCRHE